MKRLFLIPVFCCSALIVSGQNLSHRERGGTSFYVQPQAGYVMAHHDEMVHLIQGHSGGLALGYTKRSEGKKYWHHAYNFPEQGVDLWFLKTGNTRQLGDQIDGKFLLNLPLNKQKGTTELATLENKKFRHWLGLGLGLGYTTRIWDLRENSQAAVLGSHVNASLTIQYSISLLRREHSELRTGIRISHFSNGASQIPNLGTNNLGIFIGYHFVNPVKRNFDSVPVKPLTEKSRSTISMATGLKEIQPPLGKKYPTFSATLMHERRFTYKSSAGAGIDVFYNSSLNALMRENHPDRDKSKAIQAGIVLGYTLHFDKFELKMQNGIYMLDNWKNDGILYHRFGLRYRVAPKLFAQLTLKTHFAKADFIEAGIGYVFR